MAANNQRTLFSKFMRNIQSFWDKYVKPQLSKINLDNLKKYWLPLTVFMTLVVFFPTLTFYAVLIASLAVASAYIVGYFRKENLPSNDSMVAKHPVNDNSKDGEELQLNNNVHGSVIQQVSSENFGDNNNSPDDSQQQEVSNDGGPTGPTP